MQLLTRHRHAAAAIAVRLVLVAVGAGPYLLWRPEVTTPANSLLQIREGVRLLQLHLSPYRGSSCHAPPLLLTLLAPFAAHDALYVLPNIVCDCMAALLVACLGKVLVSRQRRTKQHRDAGADDHGLWLQPSQLAALYLWNPFAIMACISGSLSPVENCSVLLAVYGAAVSNASLAAFGVAVGTYMSLHPVLLLLPVGLMLAKGPEDIISWSNSMSARDHRMQQSPLGDVPAASQAATEAPGQTAAAAAAHVDADRSGEHSQAALSGLHAPTNHDRHSKAGRGRAPSQCDTSGTSAPTAKHASQPAAQQLPQHNSHPVCWGCAAFLCYFGAWSLALLLLSDLSVRAFPDAQCTPKLGTALASALGGSGSSSSSGSSGRYSTGALGTRRGGCWMGSIYGLLLSVEDYQPNIGLFWYFFTEMFDAFRAFFRFVFHSCAVVMAVPLALRFPRRPLFLAFAQLLINSLFKPYPSVGDLVPWMALLPLLQQQLAHLHLGLFLANSFLLLVVLGPAMWHQWIVVDAANSNFFYSITLLFGAWQVLLLVQMLLLTIRSEHPGAGNWARCSDAAAGMQQLLHQPEQAAAPSNVRLKAE